MKTTQPNTLTKAQRHPELDETECADAGAYFDALEDEGLLEYYAQTRYSGRYDENSN